MKPAIHPFKPEREYYFEENCFINELSNSDDDGTLSIARVTVKTGNTTRWHRLNGVEERYCVLQGSGDVYLGDQQKQPVCAGDVVLIPAGCAQRISNTGGDDLVFLAICSPRFTGDAYEAIDTTSD
jgi:mannose-6-phosphate isomerase-like protein (cupin superfamily)